MLFKTRSQVNRPSAATAAAVANRGSRQPAAGSGSPGRGQLPHRPVGGCSLPVKIFSIQLRRLIFSGLSRLPRRD